PLGGVHIMTHRIRTFLLTVLGLSALVPAIAWAAPSIEAITLSENAASRASAASAPAIDPPVTAAASSDQFLTLTATAPDADAGDVLTITAMGAPASLAFAHTPHV